MEEAALTEEAVAVPSESTYTQAASASLFLVLLLVGDLVYIAVHLVWTETRLLNSPLAALDVDRGYAEFFQYMKLLWTVLLLGLLSLRTRRWGYLAWALLFAYLLVDDSFSLHENIGRLLASRLSLGDAFGLRAIDLGELLVSAMAGGVVAVGIGWAYWRGGAEFRRSSRHLLVLLLAIVFFGVVVDMVHIAIGPEGWLDNALVILEDGGELVVTSFIAWYAFLLVIAGDRSRGASLVALISAVVGHGMAAFKLPR
jgi:hypothetical protein